MLELTKEECAELEKRVVEKIQASHPNDEKVTDMIRKLAVRTTILTIREYERMKENLPKAPPPEP